MLRYITLILIFPLFLFADIGKVLALSGSVQILRDGKTIEAFNGIALEEKDTIISGNNAQAQLMLNDKTTITVGKNSTFKIEEYFYDKTEQSKVTLKMEKGIFRTLTGKIGKINRERFKLKTKSAAISIRGTYVLMNLSDTEEDIGCALGAIYVFAKESGLAIPAGKMTIILPNGVPGPLMNLNNNLFQARSDLKIAPQVTQRIMNKAPLGNKNFNKPVVVVNQVVQNMINPLELIPSNIDPSILNESNFPSTPTDSYLYSGTQFVEYIGPLTGSVNNGTLTAIGGVDLTFDFVNNTHSGTFDFAALGVAPDPFNDAIWTGNIQGSVNNTGFTIDTITNGEKRLILDNSLVESVSLTPSTGQFGDALKQSISGDLSLTGDTSSDQANLHFDATPAP